MLVFYLLYISTIPSLTLSVLTTRALGQTLWVVVRSIFFLIFLTLMQTGTTGRKKTLNPHVLGQRRQKWAAYTSQGNFRGCLNYSQYQPLRAVREISMGMATLHQLVPSPCSLYQQLLCQGIGQLCRLCSCCGESLRQKHSLKGHYQRGH